jgi:ribosomal protein S18 acetylase RimI-like enzyme
MLSYKVLTPPFRDAACVMLARAFCNEPNVGTKASFVDWVEFVDFWMDHCCQNGLSVVCIDENQHRLAGVFLVRDFTFFPKGFLARYTDAASNLTPWMQFLLHLDRVAQQKKVELTTDKVVDLWFLGVHPDYSGRKIANVLMRETLPLVRKAGFKWATIEATSFFTSQAARFNQFEPVVEIDSEDFVWLGQKVFTKTEKPHGRWIFWVKNLQE